MSRDGNDSDIDAAAVDRIGRVLADLDESDFALVDPPAAVWEGIEASIPSPKDPPARELRSPMVVEYRIDAGDVVTDVGPGWAEFARDNGAPELVVPASDRTIWSYFDRDKVRELWQLLVQRVRALQAEARVPLRCDAPHARRWFEMTLTPAPDGMVHFRSLLVFEESRSPVELLDERTERDAGAEPIPLCSWCGRGQHGSRWLNIEELVREGRLLERDAMPPVSYGICTACRDDMSAELLVPGRVTQ